MSGWRRCDRCRKVRTTEEFDGDATTCTVVAVDSNDRVMRPAIMWMDVRAAEQAERIGQSTNQARK